MKLPWQQGAVKKKIREDDAVVDARQQMNEARMRLDAAIADEPEVRRLVNELRAFRRRNHLHVIVQHVVGGGT